MRQLSANPVSGNSEGHAPKEGAERIIAKGTVAALGTEGKKAAFYSVAYEMKLDNAYLKASRSTHFKEANKNLVKMMEAHPEFAAKIEEMIPGLKSQIIGPKGGIFGISPKPWTWHHSVETGVMQLVPRAQHTSPLYQHIFHPGGIGGFSIWGR